MNALRDADEPRGFPQLQMPPPNSFKAKTSSIGRKKVAVNQFPGLLTASRPPTMKFHQESSEERKDPIWQAPRLYANLKLDGTERPAYTSDMLAPQDTYQNQQQMKLSVINFGPMGSTEDRDVYQLDSTADQLQDSTKFVERYGPSQFVIYRGATLSSTPEFESYRATFSRNWAAIAGVIRELEDYLRVEDIKLAIINGIRVSVIAAYMSDTGVYKDDLISCISNFDDIQGSSSFSVRVTTTVTQTRAAVLIQANVRKFLCVKRFKMILLRNFCAVLIQCHARRMLVMYRVRGWLVEAKANLENRWASNVEKLKTSWTKASVSETLASSFALSLGSRTAPMRMDKIDLGATPAAAKNQIQLLIFIPSVTAAEYIRLYADSFQALQNMHIACLYQLADPLVQVVYVSPVHLSSEEIAYHESFLSVLGVPASPVGTKRLHFIVPELIDKLPPHMSLAQTLWCSSGALKKIRNFIRQTPNAVIVPTSLSWAEKRLSNHLNVPMLSPDPVIAGTISSRSFIKGVLEEACVNTPPGARDISSSLDFYVALSSLITSNIEVRRWIFRLNGDFNNEGYAYLDVDRLSVTAGLRGEIASMLEARESAAWYSKAVQLDVRKRMMNSLRTELPSKVTVCRRQMHGGSWEQFEKHFRLCGLVIEAEPSDVTGYVLGLCFIDPNGTVQATHGVNQLVDSNYQVQGYMGPQVQVPRMALQGATAAVAKLLYDKWGVIGYVGVEYETHLDPVDGSPRLHALGLKLGLSPAFLGLGAAALAGSASAADLEQSRGLLPSPDRPTGKSFVYIPYAYHRPLSSCRDDAFFKVCKMKGVGFDVESRSGTLFFRIDAMVGGTISTLCLANTRKKALDGAIHTLAFVVEQFGRNTDDDVGSPSWEGLTSTLSNLQALSKRENKKKKGAGNS